MRRSRPNIRPHIRPSRRRRNRLPATPKPAPKPAPSPSRSSRRRRRPSTASRRAAAPPRAARQAHPARTRIVRDAASGASARRRAPRRAAVKFAAPPPGDLQYDTFYNGMQNMIGTIHWRTDGRTYDLSVSMPVPFVGPFSYRSEGRIDAFGVAPDRYVEKRGKRPEDIAIFNREIRQVVFTRTPNNAPLPDGVQDRFSMLMQLSGLVRGNPAAYKPGVTQQFFVIDNNSGETWPITVIGDEDVQTQAGIIRARHFMRLPRRDGDTRRIDMWLAPSLDWLPARLVQSEPNGSQIELLWHGRLAPPDAPTAGATQGATKEGATNAPASAPAAEPAQPTPPPAVQPPAPASALPASAPAAP
ncbi:DUF3108 domain-containing protein [Burkholderia sp. USMB20]|nr:DUF3108 domain-containing protein [Burkholderia sp. USMB20]